jgi:predicted DsbA family dithiol-disulfide isomerase
MTYESQISFTFDTICPWTYLAKRRLSLALDAFHTAHPDSPVSFKLKFLPYQLYPAVSKEGEDKMQWYKKSRYGDSDEKMNMYKTIMSSYGRPVNISFKFGGVVANTINAHRVVQHWQEEKGPDVAEKIVDCGSSYFSNLSWFRSENGVPHC